MYVFWNQKRPFPAEEKAVFLLQI